MPPSPLSWCYRDLTWSPTSSVLWPEIIQNLSCDTHHSFLSSKNSIHLLCKVIFLFVVVQSLRHVQLFVTPWATARQDSLSITNSRSLLKLMSIALVMPPTIRSSFGPFSSHLQSFPVSGSFQMSQWFASGGQSIGISASASELPMNIQD